MTDLNRTGNWNIITKPVRKATLAVGTRVVRKADGRKGKIVGRAVGTSPLYKARFWPTIWTIRYDDGGFDASGDTAWVRGRFKVVS